MRSEEKRLKALDDIRENIAKSGFHTYVVTGGGRPHFGYTIGLTESLGAELILPSTNFYRLREVAPLITDAIGTTDTKPIRVLQNINMVIDF
jgi:hypothetical protein